MLGDGEPGLAAGPAAALPRPGGGGGPRQDGLSGGAAALACRLHLPPPAHQVLSPGASYCSVLQGAVRAGPGGEGPPAGPLLRARQQLGGAGGGVRTRGGNRTAGGDRLASAC